MKFGATFHIIIGLIIGAVILCLLSIFQYILIDADILVLKNYMVPAGFGAIVGVIVGYLWYRSNRILFEKTKVEETAITDELTGLYNRRGFFFLSKPQMELAIRNNKKLLLVYIDIDNLKNINDRLGHESGDRALIEAANILKSTFRKSDIIARIGGDEFVIFPVDSGEDSYSKLIDHIKAALDNFNNSQDSFLLSFSFGKAVYDPHDPASIDILLSRADTKMYKEKKAKNNNS